MPRLQRFVLLNGVVLATVTLMSASVSAQSSSERMTNASALQDVETPQANDPRRGPRGVAADVMTKEKPKTQKVSSQAVTSVTSGNFRVSGTGGDPVTGDQYRAFDHPAIPFTMQTVMWEFNRTHLRIDVGDYANGGWLIMLEAPLGADLAVGKYEGAGWWGPDWSNKPRMRVHSSVAGCAYASSFFEVHQIVLNADRTVQAIDVTFKQHCYSFPSFAFGHLLVNAAALPHETPTVGFDAAAEGTVASRKLADGFVSNVKLSGQISCSANVEVSVTGSLTQVRDGQTITRPANKVAGSCTPASGLQWRIEGAAKTPSTLLAGAAQVQAVISVYDLYGMPAPQVANDSILLTEQSPLVKLGLNSASLRLSGDFLSYLGSPDRLGYSYSSANHPMEVWSDGTYLLLGASSWNVYLGTAGTSKLAVGKYNNAYQFNTGIPYNNETLPSQALYYGGEGCPSATGAFEVHQIAYNTDGSLSGIDVTFEDRCGSRVVYGHLLANMSPLRAVTRLTGDAYVLDGFSKRTPVGMNNGGNIYGEVTCSTTGQLKLSGTVTQNGATVPFKTTIDCTTGSAVEWRVFGTQLGESGFTNGTGTANISIVPADPYLAAYRIMLSPEIFILI